MSFYSCPRYTLPPGTHVSQGPPAAAAAPGAVTGHTVGVEPGPGPGPVQGQGLGQGPGPLLRRGAPVLEVSSLSLALSLTQPTAPTSASTAPPPPPPLRPPSSTFLLPADDSPTPPPPSHPQKPPHPASIDDIPRPSEASPRHAHTHLHPHLDDHNDNTHAATAAAAAADAAARAAAVALGLPPPPPPGPLPAPPGAADAPWQAWGGANVVRALPPEAVARIDALVAGRRAPAGLAAEVRYPNNPLSPCAIRITH